VTTVAATLAGASDAATLTASGNVVFAFQGGGVITVSLASADTADQAATKIDTALTGYADAAIVSSKLNVVSTLTGNQAFVKVVSGNATVLGNLGISVGQVAFGADGLPAGASDVGPTAATPGNDPTVKENREPGYWPLSPDKNVTIANDATNLTKTEFPAPVDFDFDASGVDAEEPSLLVLKPKSTNIAGGKKVTISGDNLEGVTGVTFGGTAATDLDVSAAGDGVITVTAPAHAAGAVDVVVTDDIGATTLTGGFTYKA
jgi:hypothetical protein